MLHMGPSRSRRRRLSPSFVETTVLHGPQETARSCSINRELFSLRAPLQYCCSLKRFILITSCLQDPLCFLELEPTFVSGPGAPVSHDFTCMCIYSSWKKPSAGNSPTLGSGEELLVVQDCSAVHGQSAHA